MTDYLKSGEAKLFTLIAGLDCKTAVAKAKSLEKDGIVGLLNIGGEYYKDEKLSKEDCQKYLELIDLIRKEKCKASISIKPTQIGLGTKDGLFLECLMKICEEASKFGTTIEIDMEDYETLDETVDVFLKVCTKYSDKMLMRIALPAEFRICTEVTKKVVGAGGGVRLIRGKCYGDIEEKLKYDGEELLDHYIKMAELIPPKKLALATGNTKLLERVYKVVKGKPEEIEHQFLLGLAYHAKVYDQMLKDGKKVTLYMTSGSWEKVSGYVTRRKVLGKEELEAVAKKHGK